MTHYHLYVIILISSLISGFVVFKIFRKRRVKNSAPLTALIGVLLFFIIAALCFFFFEIIYQWAMVSYRQYETIYPSSGPHPSVLKGGDSHEPGNISPFSFFPSF